MAETLRILFLENDPTDVELLGRELQRAGIAFEPLRAETEQEYAAHLAAHPDLILADYNLPTYDALRALRRLRESGLQIPCIVVTGSIGDEAAVECLRLGAADYLLKDRLSRLGAAVSQVLESRRLREEARRAEVALRESEERFRLLYEQAPAPYQSLDADGHILEVNQAWLEALGYVREEVIGRWFGDLLTPGSRAQFRERFPRFKAAGATHGSELELVRKDGSTCLASFEGRVGYDGWGNFAQTHCVFIDVTERRRMERERDLLEGKLRQQQKLEALGLLAGGVAHEINNPVNGIMNYAELIADRAEADSDVATFAREIVRETERVAGIVRNLLAFARQSPEAAGPVHLVECVEATLSLVRAALRRDQIALEVVIPGDLPPARGRGQQLQQVLMNLLTNARDALNERFPGHDPGKRLRVTARALDRDGSPWVRLTVENAGHEIPAEIQERIFDPFFTTKPKDKGTGLGLSISHGIVTEHGGQLWVESAPGQPTRFHVELPAS